jgi:hypothetical protein
VKLPEIHEAQRLELRPGDVLVVRNTEIEVTSGQAREIERAVREHLGRPDLKVMVLGRDWEVAVIRDKTVNFQPRPPSPWRPWEHDIRPEAEDDLGPVMG